jgi:hypothetical protein
VSDIIRGIVEASSARSPRAAFYLKHSFGARPHRHFNGYRSTIKEYTYVIYAEPNKIVNDFSNLHFCTVGIALLSFCHLLIRGWSSGTLATCANVCVRDFNGT